MMTCDGDLTQVSVTVTDAVSCPSGQEPSSSGGCDDCNEGKYSSSSSGSCAPCPAGTYSGTTGATSASTCQPCAEGKSSAAGASSCFSIGEGNDVIMSGMCDERVGTFDGAFRFMALTASGRAWYKNAKGVVLYWDPDCDGGAADTPPLWLLSSGVVPSTSAESDLDGEL